MRKLDLLIKNGNVVLSDYVSPCSVGVADGKIVAIADHLSESDAVQVIDAMGLTVFPGAVDCHTHLGIYHPMEIDAKLRRNPL